MAAGIPQIFSHEDGTRFAPTELHCIMAIDNLRSVLECGILSHKRADRIEHTDVANIEVNDRRAGKVPPNPVREDKEKQALRIHRYANLYISGNNAMLHNIVTRHGKSRAEQTKQRNKICILRIDPSILERDEVLVAKQNAATDEAQFENAGTCQLSPRSTAILTDRYSEILDNETKRPTERHRKPIRQAEVLVPYQLDPSYIRGIYVANMAAKIAVGFVINQPGQGRSPLPVTIHPTLFFDGRWGNPTQNTFGLPVDLVNPPEMYNDFHQALNTDYPESSDEEDPMHMGEFTVSGSDE